jgi:protein-glutamine gamma-glutamyltransferase
MSAAAAAPRTLVRDEPGAAPAMGEKVVGTHWIRLACFAALAAWGAAHWAGLVVDASFARTAGGVAVAVAGAALLVLLARASVAAPLRYALAGAVGALTVAVGLVIAGLPAGLLKPARWDELGDGVDRGLSGVRTVEWPYGGEEEWIRLVILLGAPLLLGVAATLAFWPAKRAGPFLRAAGLVVLLLLYGTAVTERDPGAPLLRGLVLLGLVAAWLWLPRLRPREALPGAALVLAVGIATLPVAARLNADAPWWNYREWTWFGSGKAVVFDWTHSYGPLNWPREGTTLLNVKADRGHYWKTEVLDRFDGFRWLRSDRNDFTQASAELPPRPNPRWNERIRVTVRALRSDLIVGVGTTQLVTGIDDVATFGDGTSRVLDGPLERGDSYGVQAYAPNPSADQMRAAGLYEDFDLLQYTELYLPGPGENALEGSGLDTQASRSSEIQRNAVTVALRGWPGTGSPDVRAELLDSRYADVYRLARRLTAGAPTTYEAVKNVERYLQQNYDYAERVPNREFPLLSFLFEDRGGYCQQFSGAMALMLRMAGIPARVSSGFSPGSFNRDSGEWRVRDLDAHSWVEVNFADIGWVPFDPTPSASPAESQSGGPGATSAARGDAAEALQDRGLLAGGGAPDSGGGSTRDGGPTLEIWLLPLALIVAALAWVMTVLALERRRRQKLAPAERADVQLSELERALRRLGWPLPPGTTLLGLERRLGSAAGPDAARYVAGIRAHRFAPATPPAPGRPQRRALRRELTAHGGPLARLRGYLALPPLGPRAPRADS